MEVKCRILIMDDSPRIFLQLENVKELGLKRRSFLVGLISIAHERHRHVLTNYL